MSPLLYEYDGQLFPDFLRRGNAMRFVAPFAKEFCQGRGLDVGAGPWALPGATPVELANGGNAYCLPAGEWDYVFSSHCLEHLLDPVGALEHWRSRLREGGTLFLYLPHPAMRYWRPERNRKHLHLFRPEDVQLMLEDLGFVDVIRSERDLFWSFVVVGFRG